MKTRILTCLKWVPAFHCDVRAIIRFAVALAWTLLSCANTAGAQTAAPINSSTPNGEYRRGYDAGYEAGLRAAKASLAATPASGLAVVPGPAPLISESNLEPRIQRRRLTP